ncbi:MAG: AAA family ATPase, partial [Bacteroidota bacterium]|nr:AAA family ATPase [Bacteroidota bacterium]
MLTSLNIKNYTLIENLQINFESGYSVITGETGAGKSMLLGALGLILGKRADLSSLKNKEEKCTIEACFDIRAYNLNEVFEQNDLDYEDNTIIRREILPSGKSRAFVNDTPATLQQLEDIGVRLMEIHSQHQTRELTEEEYQLAFLDILGGNHSLLKEYKNSLVLYKKNQKELDQL